MDKYRIGDIYAAEDGSNPLIFDGQKWLPVEASESPNGEVWISVNGGDWQDFNNFRQSQPSPEPTQKMGPLAKRGFGRWELAPDAFQDLKLKDFTLGVDLVKAVKNTPDSVAKLAEDVGQMIAHPIDTATGLAKTVAGYGQKAAGLTGYDFLGTEYAPYAEAMNQYFDDRYGGYENIGRTIEEDPVGLAADVATLLSGAGAGLRAGGKIGAVGARTSSALGRAGQTVAKAGVAIDPIGQAWKWGGVGLGKLRDKASSSLYASALKPGTNLTPAERSAMVQTGLRERLATSEGGVDKANRLLGDLGKQVDDLVQTRDTMERAGAVPRNIDPNLLTQGAIQQIEKLYGTAAPTGDLRSADSVLGDFINWHGRDTLGTAAAHELKKRTQKKVANAYDMLSTPEKEANKALAHGLKEAVAGNVPEIAPLNKRMGELFGLQPYLERAAGRGQNANLISLTGTMAGGGAGPGAAAGVGLLGSLLGRGKSRAAIALDRMSPGRLPYGEQIVRATPYGLSTGRIYQAAQNPSLLDYFTE